MYNIFYVIILFIFVLSLLLVNLPRLGPEDSLYQKIYIFVGVFLFEIAFEIGAAIYRKCIIDLRAICISSLITALIAVVGLAVYDDFAKNKWKFESDTKQKLVITSIITIFVIFKQFFYVILGTSSVCPK